MADDADNWVWHHGAWEEREIGYAAVRWGGATNVAVVNQGTISADVSGGTITINAQPFSNLGLAQALNGGTLKLNNSWNNSGTLVESGGTLNLGGSFSTAGLGIMQRDQRRGVYLTGSLNNTNNDAGAQRGQRFLGPARRDDAGGHDHARPTGRHWLCRAGRWTG